MVVDPLGRAMFDYHRGLAAGTLVYRDGDDLEPHDVARTYFAPPETWSPAWKRRLGSLDGPILDVGCGAGTEARWLESRGRDVMAIDVSPGAVATARARGVADVRRMDMFDLDLPPGRFQSVLVKGTQLGLAGSLPGVRAFLGDLGTVTDEGAAAIVDSYDPRALDPDSFTGYRSDPRPGLAHRAFHFEYRRPVNGDIQCDVGRTLTFVLFGPDRLRDVVIGTPWTLAGVYPRGGYYRARLEK